jgi:hypothetical protein
MVWEGEVFVFCFFVDEEVGRVECRRFRRFLLVEEEGPEEGLYQHYNKHGYTNLRFDESCRNLNIFIGRS